MKRKSKDSNGEVVTNNTKKQKKGPIEDLAVSGVLPDSVPVLANLVESLTIPTILFPEFLMSWEFLNSFRKQLNLPSISLITWERCFRKDDRQLLSRVHISLLTRIIRSSVLGEQAAAVHFVKVVPVNPFTWPEVLRQVIWC